MKAIRLWIITTMAVAGTMACLAGTAPAAAAAAASAVTACPATMENYSDASRPLECRCPANPQGRVWGTDLYTLDSNLCAAAVHAGVVMKQGGVIVVELAAGAGHYDASSRNGVDSLSWGSWGSSFRFVIPEREAGAHGTLASGNERAYPAAMLSGTWSGQYECPQGLTSARLTLKEHDGGALDGVFEFSAHPSNPSVPSGSYEIHGTYEPAVSRVDLEPGNWIEQPTGYSSVGMAGRPPGPNGILRLQLDSAACTFFVGKRDPNAPGAGNAATR